LKKGRGPTASGESRYVFEKRSASAEQGKK